MPAFIIWSLNALIKAVAILWFVSGIIFEGLGVPLLFLEQYSQRFVPVIPGTFALIIGLIIVYTRIENKYRIK